MGMMQALELILQTSGFDSLFDQRPNAIRLGLTARHPVEHVAGIAHVRGIVMTFATEKNQIFR